MWRVVENRPPQASRWDFLIVPFGTTRARLSGGSQVDTGQPWHAEVAKFAVVGAFGFLTDVGGFNLLRFGLGGEGPLYQYPLSAKVISGVAATIVAWLGNRTWTYRETKRRSRLTEFAVFAAVALIGTGIAMGCLWFSHYVLRLKNPIADNISANGIGLVLATAFRFWAYRTHVFSESGDGSVLADIAEHSRHEPGRHEPHHDSQPDDRDGPAPREPGTSG